MLGETKSLSPAGRESYWEEKTADEKLETLARQVEYLTSRVNLTAQRLDQLRNHHHANGKMLFEKFGAEQEEANRQRGGGPLNRKP